MLPREREYEEPVEALESTQVNVHAVSRDLYTRFLQEGLFLRNPLLYIFRSVADDVIHTRTLQTRSDLHRSNTSICSVQHRSPPTSAYMVTIPRAFSTILPASVHRMSNWVHTLPIQFQPGRKRTFIDVEEQQAARLSCYSKPAPTTRARDWDRRYLMNFTRDNSEGTTLRHDRKTRISQPQVAVSERASPINPFTLACGKSSK